MPLAKQYLDSSHTESRFWPLLELQPQQQSAIFSRVTMEASLIMCSQLAADAEIGIRSELRIHRHRTSLQQLAHLRTRQATGVAEEAVEAQRRVGG